MAISLNDAVVSSRDFQNLNMKEKRRLVDPWLSEQSIGLMSGWRGTGKTWAALSLANCVTRGGAFGPWECNNPVPVLYLDAEMPMQDVKDRLRTLSSDTPSAKPLYIYSDHLASEMGLPRAHLKATRWQRDFRQILKDREIRLVIFDNLASLSAGVDENSVREWSPINTFLLGLRFEGVSSLLLHHTGKGGAQRGTSAREDNLDYSIILRRPWDCLPEQGCRFILHFSKSRVSTKSLSLISDFEFQLREDPSGASTWTYGDVRGETKKAVIRHFADGTKQSDIASLIAVSAGRVSQIIAQARKEDLITMKGSLTGKGHLFLGEDEG